MCAELRDDGIFQSHTDIVDAGSCGTSNLYRRRNQAVAELGRSQKRNAAMRSYRPFIVGIGGKRKCRIGQRENRASIRDAEAIDHSRESVHRDRDNRSRPRLWSVASCAHKKSAHARASLRDEMAATLLTESS